MTKLIVAFHTAHSALHHAGMKTNEAIAQRVQEIIHGTVAQEREACDLYETLCGHMDDDMDTPTVVATLFSVAQRIEERAHSASGSKEVMLANMAVYYDFCTQVLGIAPEKTQAEGNVAQLVEALLQVRREARADKNFALSDTLRDVLSKAGITLSDNPDGTSSWSYELINDEAEA